MRAPTRRRRDRTLASPRSNVARTLVAACARRGAWPIAGARRDREAAVELQARTLLKRYGVVFRRLLAREANVAPWRELTRVYRRLEARGEIRGGRFVSGMSGEQFALGGAIEQLREIRRTPADGRCLVISAADPLNLAGIVTDRRARAGGRRHAHRLPRRRPDCRHGRRLCATIDRVVGCHAGVRRRGGDDAGGTADAGGAQRFSGEVMMRSIACALALAVVGDVDARRAGQEDSRPRRPPKTISLSGCVVRGEKTPDQYTLDDAAEGKYRLTGLNLRDYIGQRVQIAGGDRRDETADDQGRADAERERRRLRRARWTRRAPRWQPPAARPDRARSIFRNSR